MSRPAGEQAADPIQPELLASGGVFDRHNASVKTEAWNTTSHPVRLTLADATGQHASAVYLSFEAVEQLARDLKACYEARRAFDAARTKTDTKP
ncbi:hypothetical protein [Salinisphaera sp. LB1]|uniref:hypothetical protein n=1 Tax=Salinisphaera sp. LB1 TaxID=2183911 RepID=UPI000D706124|nr:hypothetical protein [Salinisphaera sp. LB1]AWN16620.1 hypothetical protein SALB1_2422 [Salinisphaera sp. LB1]